MMSNFPIDEFIFLRCNVDIEQVYRLKKHKHTHQKKTHSKKKHTPKKHTHQKKTHTKKTKKTEQMYWPKKWNLIPKIIKCGSPTKKYKINERD